MELFEDLMYLFSSCVENRGIVRLNLKEAALLYKIAKMTNANIVEIGRKYGGSALLLASAVGPDQKVYSIDIVNHKHLKTHISMAPKSVQDKLVLFTDTSANVAKKWNEIVDLVFIDGDHTYKAVKQDIEMWCPFIKSGGFAVFHDVVGTNLGLDKLTDNLVSKGWIFVESADTMLVLRKP